MDVNLLTRVRVQYVNPYIPLRTISMEQQSLWSYKLYLKEHGLTVYSYKHTKDMSSFFITYFTLNPSHWFLVSKLCKISKLENIRND